VGWRGGGPPPLNLPLLGFVLRKLHFWEIGSTKDFQNHSHEIRLDKFVWTLTTLYPYAFARSQKIDKPLKKTAFGFIWPGHLPEFNRITCFPRCASRTGNNCSTLASNPKSFCWSNRSPHPTPPHPALAFPSNVMAFPINFMPFQIIAMAFPVTGCSSGLAAAPGQAMASNWERHNIEWERHNIKWKRRVGVGCGPMSD